MHTLKIAVLRPSPGADFGALRDSLTRRIDRVPSMRMRLAFPPGGYGRPSWVEDDAFDVDRHLVRLDARAPFGHRELCEVVARAGEAPLLDRTRPLWQLWVVGGLAEERLAVVARVHHAFADGVSFARILASWFEPEAQSQPPGPGRPAGAFEHLLGTLASGSAEAVRDLAAFARAARTARRSPQPKVPPLPFSGRPLEPERRFGCHALPLNAVHSARKPLGITVNDLLIAIVAGALRGYLLEREQLPADPLVATMPVSLLPPAEHGPLGNRGLATTKLTLPTNIENPLARAHAASVAAKRAKQDLDATAGARLDDAVDLLPRSAVRAAAGLIDSGRLSLGNLSLSNVRGPAEPLAADGFTVEDFFSVGPCAPGVGLNITAWSYADRFNVSMLTDAGAIPDPWQILERLPGELDALLAETRQTG